MRGSHEEPIFKLRGQLVDTHMNREAFRRCSPVVDASMNAPALLLLMFCSIHQLIFLLFVVVVPVVIHLNLDLNPKKLYSHAKLRDARMNLDGKST